MAWISEFTWILGENCLTFCDPVRESQFLRDDPRLNPEPTFTEVSSSYLVGTLNPKPLDPKLLDPAPLIPKPQKRRSQDLEGACIINFVESRLAVTY